MKRLFFQKACVAASAGLVGLTVFAGPWVKCGDKPCSNFPLKFAENATIYVKVGLRPLKKGDQLVSWTDAALYYHPSGFMAIVK